MRARAMLGLVLILVGVAVMWSWALPWVETQIRHLAAEDRAVLGGVSAPGPTRPADRHRPNARLSRSHAGGRRLGSVRLAGTRGPWRGLLGGSRSRGGHDRTARQRRAAAGGVSWWLFAWPVLVLVGVVAASVLSRLWFRGRREYCSYRLGLSGHDRPSPKQVVAAVSTIGESVAEPLARRVWRGQPVFGVQLDYDPRGGGSVIVCVVCEPRHVVALDAALRQAYPHCRVGFGFKARPAPVPAVVSEPRVLWRLCRSGDPIYPLYDTLAEEELRPPLAAAATMLHGLDQHPPPGVGRAERATSVRVLVLPGNRTAAYLRARHRRRERKGRLGSQIAHGMYAPQSSVDSQQARQSVQLSEHALFHAEVQIAADEQIACKRLSGALSRYAGMNTLRRRSLLVRERLYRRRWASFRPPLLMRGSRKVMSALELGHLLQLPGAASTSAPIAWIAEPRLPSAPGYPHQPERGTPIPGEAPGQRDLPQHDARPASALEQAA